MEIETAPLSGRFTDAENEAGAAPERAAKASETGVFFHNGRQGALALSSRTPGFNLAMTPAVPQPVFAR
ncbi:hypothetical protein DFR50_12639 [Roseiarcus fermentans]|uniref:Uncharacterized protein n=1 Tax=Roseiarcus fermentans TaxID=1473586 RepID=A0A366F0R3_9HYPH|nr:hypothetical protein DFR50_12639 [Roseiarcus fermentans]